MDDITMWVEILQTVGVPSLALAGAGFFIYKNQIWASQERAQFMQRDEDSDARVFAMMEKQNENANKLSIALEGLTQSNEHLSDKISMMVDVVRNHDRSNSKR
jgi:K+/H+ antiporter YhaU regulatory subunit KhtT